MFVESADKSPLTTLDCTVSLKKTVKNDANN